jgi:hypothetical protein
MKTLKNTILSSLCAVFALSAFGACNESQINENTFDPVGTYAFYSLSDGTNTYLAGQSITINSVRQELFQEKFIFTFQADGTAEYFTFGEEELRYGTWTESENDYLITMEINGIYQEINGEPVETKGTIVQAKGDDEFLSWTENGYTYTLKKTQTMDTETYSAYYGKYSFTSLIANSVEYLEGETYLNLKTLSKENYHYRIMPNGLLQVCSEGKDFVARWSVENGKLSFLLPYNNGAKSCPAVVDSILGLLTVTTERQGSDNATITEKWEFSNQ